MDKVSYWFDDFDIEIETVTAILHKKFKYEENIPKIGSIISHYMGQDQYRTYKLLECSVDNETVRLKMRPL